MSAPNILVIAAHPDDEVLGCGGYLAKMAKRGSNVTVAFLADGVTSRDGSQEVDHAERQRSARHALSVLGVRSYWFGTFPDNQMDTVPLLEIVKTIERLIDENKPEVLLTHHCGDVNIDHRRIHEATIAACRPQAGHSVKTLLFFEVPSSTEWQTPQSGPAFAPNWFEDISDTLETKLTALRAYAMEMREWPHPRSIKGAEALANWRGATIGVDAAEAFVLGRQRS